MTPPPELLLIRHAAAHCTRTGVLAGTHCTGLTASGQRQASLLATWLLREHHTVAPVQMVHTSTTERASQTATTVATRLNVPLRRENDLRVPDPGPRAEGQPWSTVRQRYRGDPDWPAWPLIDAGESWTDYATRSQARLATILNTLTGRVVVIGHTETTISLLLLLLGGTSLGMLELVIPPTGITHIRAVPVSVPPSASPATRRWEIVSLGTDQHLRPLQKPAAPA
jgi:2,3-bisphosphoglycerate-dependent phosphoglycerate mutase